MSEMNEVMSENALFSAFIGWLRECTRQRRVPVLRVLPKVTLDLDRSTQSLYAVKGLEAQQVIAILTMASKTYWRSRIVVGKQEGGCVRLLVVMKPDSFRITRLKGWTVIDTKLEELT